MIENKILEYYSNGNHSFSVTMDESGRKTGKLMDIKNGNVIAENLHQMVLPENIPNLLNVLKVIISSAWQDGKILPAEKEAFEEAFQNVNFTKKQRKEIEKEFLNPTPIAKLLKYISTRDEKLIILETSLNLIIADNEFHPKEKIFIEYLVKEFQLDSADFALIYQNLPPRLKKYIVKENLHKTLEIKIEEIKTLDKFTPPISDKTSSHKIVYATFLSNWNNKRSRYSKF